MLRHRKNKVVKCTDLWRIIGREEAEQQQQHHASKWRQPLRIDCDVGDDKDDDTDENADVDRPTANEYHKNKLC